MRLGCEVHDMVDVVALHQVRDLQIRRAAVSVRGAGIRAGRNATSRAWEVAWVGLYEVAIGDVSLTEVVVGLSLEVRYIVPRRALVEDVDCRRQGSESARATGAQWCGGIFGAGFWHSGTHG